MNTLDKVNKTLGMLAGISTSFILIKREVMSDVDVLVDADWKFNWFRTALMNRGYKRLIYPFWCRWQPANERYKEIWVHRGGELLDIHLHRHIAWGSVLYMKGEWVAYNSIKQMFFGYLFMIPNTGMSGRIEAYHTIFENFEEVSKKLLLSLRVKKVINDIIHHFNLVNTYFELEAYFFDCVKMFIVWPLRKCL